MLRRDNQLRAPATTLIFISAAASSRPPSSSNSAISASPSGMESDFADEALQRRPGAIHVAWRHPLQIFDQGAVGLRQAWEQVRHR